MTWLGKLTQYLLMSLILLLSAVAAPKPVLAHAEYDHAEPSANAIITATPTQVQIWFTQDLFRRAGMNRIEVYDADGQRVDQEDPTIDDDNRRLLTVSLQPDLADGVYTVRWYSLSSEDGHEGEGEFRFTVESTGTVSATGQITATSEVTATDEGATSASVAAAAVAEPTGKALPTATDVPPTARPASQSPTLPCMGGAAPLVLALGSVVMWRRRLARRPM